jgi:formylglycine-generating enzyme required for sulfatase activity
MPVQRTRSFVVAGTVAVSLSVFPATAFLLSSRESISPETMEIIPRVSVYRLAGDFHWAGRSVDAPRVTIARHPPLHIMRRQVTAAEYGRCIAAGECRKNASDPKAASDLPVVNVSWHDATAYAAWLSKETGYSWRLPTDEEWAVAAGSRFHDDALSVAASSDPSVRWLARYEMEAGGDTWDRRPRRIGAFGANEYGLLDMSGNVWEWTNTCFIRQSLDQDGQPVGAPTPNCGVRVAEGKHRAYVSDFIRDASSGGCAAGKPPSNLGFRLIRDDAGYAFVRRLKRLLFGVGCLSVRSEACRTGLFPS